MGTHLNARGLLSISKISGKKIGGDLSNYYHSLDSDPQKSKRPTIDLENI